MDLLKNTTDFTESPLDYSTTTNNLLTFSWIDYTLFSAMFGVSALIGIYFGCFGTKQSSTKEYLLGGKTMSVFPIGMSLIASNLSGITLLGIPSEIYMFGTQYWACLVCTLVVTVTMVYVYLPVFYKLQLNSSYEYLELRFDKRIRTMASAIFIMNAILYVPIVIYIPALAFNQVSGINIHLVTPIVCLVCIFYTTLGGLKAVVWTDTLQFSVTIAAMVAVFFMGTSALGGFSAVWEKAEEGGRIEFFNMNPDPTERCTFWGITIGMTVLWVVHSGMNQASIQRYLALPSLNSAKKAIVIFGVGVIVTKCLSCSYGLIKYAKYHDCDPITLGKVKRMDQLLPYYVLDVANTIPGLSGIFISGVFSTALSTMSTCLNTMSGTLYEDFIRPYRKTKQKPSEDKESNIMKGLVVVLGFICVSLVFLVEKLGGVLQISGSFSGITGGQLLGVFTLGMIFPSANTKGVLCGSIASTIFVSWMCIGQQTSYLQGSMVNVPKPLSVEGCSEFLNVSSFSSTIAPELLPEEPFWLFRVSFYWYAVIGLFITMVVGLIVSHYTKDEKAFPVDKDLLSPCIYRFLPANYPSTPSGYYLPAELKLIEKNLEKSILLEEKLPDKS